MKRLGLAALLFFAGLMHAFALEATVSRLTTDGGQYRTISAAFNAVAQAGGGIVTVLDSATYAECMATGSASWQIAIRAAEGKTPTLQVGVVTAPLDAFFYMQGNGQRLSLSGFKIDVLLTVPTLDAKLFATYGVDQVVTLRNCVVSGLVNRFLIRMDGTRPTLNLLSNRFFLAYEGATYIESALVGMVADNATLKIDQCTYVQNPTGRSPLYYGVIWCDRGNPSITLTNSIFEDQSAQPRPVVHIWSAVSNKGTGAMRYCNYPAGLAGENFPVTPEFSRTSNAGLLNPAAGDFRLAASSPCIGKGDPSTATANIGWDQITSFGAVEDRIRNIRSVTYYPFPLNWGNIDLADLALSLDRLKSIGGNTVWFVLPWFNFQSQALPTPIWNEAAVSQLNSAIGLAEARGISVILPLCYLGVGWSPTGIDPLIWSIDSAMYGAFKTYAKAMMTRLGSHHNMMFLLYTEGSEPAHDKLRDIPQYAASFKAYCQETNASIAYWNNRWGTSYTWTTIQPATVPWSGGLRTTDHYRWVAWIMRKSHGVLAVEADDQLGQNLIGFHDYLYSGKYVDAANTPIPSENPYDFLSIAHYYNSSQIPSTDTFSAELNDIIARYASAFPGAPIVFGETGACASSTGLTLQSQVVDVAASLGVQEGVGVNFWMWQDFAVADECQRSFGMLDVDGNPKPSYDALFNNWSTFVETRANDWTVYD